MNTIQTETVTERAARLNCGEINEKRLESLSLAHPFVTDEIFQKIASATRVKRNSETIILPLHRFENLSRGRGWARQGKGGKATWGERVDGGYECGAGKWTIGGNDGFSRKGSADWEVSHVIVSEKVWTIAN